MVGKMEMLLRMFADIALPTSERAELVATLYSAAETAKTYDDKLNLILDELRDIKLLTTKVEIVEPDIESDNPKNDSPDQELPDPIADAVSANDE